jgi:hypothetical protein
MLAGACSVVLLRFDTSEGNKFALLRQRYGLSWVQSRTTAIDFVRLAVGDDQCDNVISGCVETSSLVKRDGQSRNVVETNSLAAPRNICH